MAIVLVYVLSYQDLLKRKQMDEDYKSMIILQ